MRTLPTLAALVTVTVLAGAASGAAPSWVPPIAVAAGVSSQVALTVAETRSSSWAPAVPFAPCFGRLADVYEPLSIYRCLMSLPAPWGSQ